MLNQDIKRLFTMYGIIPVLVVLTEQERLENYELCNYLLKGIRHVFSESEDVPTRFDEKSFDWLDKERAKMGLKPTDYIYRNINLNGYVNDIYRDLNLKREYPIVNCINTL